jgi:hypothetical protein
VAAGCALTGAVTVFILGVIATSGTYGSRMAWLLGVTLPLLALAAGLFWLCSVVASRRGDSSTTQVRNVLTLFALTAFAVPFVIALVIASVYGLLFALDGVHRLVH